MQAGASLRLVLYLSQYALRPHHGMNYHRRYGRLANANTLMADAWELCVQIPTIREDYEGQAVLYKWPESYRQFVVGSHWAYWFARHVICDRWPGAEALIKSDQQVWHWYLAYLEMCLACRILGASVVDDPDYNVDNNGLIIGWKPGRGLLRRKVKTMPSRLVDLDAVADGIAAEMSAFRKKKKLLEGTNED